MISDGTKDEFDYTQQQQQQQQVFIIINIYFFC
jgi:hypothetical protein